MKKFLLGSAAAIAMAASSSALAADVAARGVPAPAVAVPGWAGFYGGLNGGWISSASNTISNTGSDTDGGGLGTALRTGAIPTSVDVRYNGFILGVQAGYNWQMGPVVLGLEADIDGASASKSVTVGPITIPGFVPQTSAFTRQLDWLGTARGRLGWTPVNPLLLYVTGGAAFGQTTIGNQYICPACGPPSSTEPSTVNRDTRTALGWTAGAGGEWAFSAKWSAKLEYLYVDLGSHSSTITYTYGTQVSTMTSTVHDKEHIVRAGINYRFN